MANDWDRLDQTLLEEHTILAGPRWTTMGSFHNYYLLYGKIPHNEAETDRFFVGLHPDEFPRIVGDNNVLFNNLRSALLD